MFLRCFTCVLFCTIHGDLNGVCREWRRKGPALIAKTDVFVLSEQIERVCLGYLIFNCQIFTLFWIVKAKITGIHRKPRFWANRNSCAQFVNHAWRPKLYEVCNSMREFDCCEFRFNRVLIEFLNSEKYQVPKQFSTRSCLFFILNRDFWFLIRELDYDWHPSTMLSLHHQTHMSYKRFFLLLANNTSVRFVWLSRLQRDFL